MIFFCFQIDGVTPSQGWIQLKGTVLPLPTNYRYGFTTIVAGTNFGLAGSFPISVTTAGTIILTLNLTGTVNSINIKAYQAVRIA
jgi:hypothetical protein